MAWLNDLSAALGLPIGAVTLATSLVLAAEKAEKEARPEALRDIAEALKNPRWTEAFRPNLQIRRVFESTFSGRHLSWKCLRRSMAASVIFILALIGFFITRTGRNPFEQLTTFYPGVWYKVFLIVLFFLLTFSCAFIALYKTRVIVRKMSRAGNMMAVIFYMLSDIGLSLTIPFALGATLFITIEFIAGYLDAESWAALESDIATYPVVVSQSLLCVLTLVHWVKQIVQGGGRVWPGSRRRIWPKRTVLG